MDDDISNIISAYLEAYAYGHRNPSDDIIRIIKKNPKQAFNAIAEFSGPLPNNLDFRDINDPLCRLLLNIADSVPDLMIPRMINGYWASRYLFISSAAASESLKFIPTLIDLLTDRSIYIKTLILQLIINWPHLQVSEMIPKLEKLSKMKSFQNADEDQALLEQATKIFRQAT